MIIKQISVFVENKFGRLAKITQVLSQNNIDIEALTLADTTDYGILRIIVDKPELALSSLKESGIVAKSTEVISTEIDNTPGGLSKVLSKLEENDITVEYMYAFVGKENHIAHMVVKTDNLEKTDEVLK